MHEEAIYKVAIIGGGPKGLYGLERLMAQIVHQQIQTPVQIYIFNKTPHFGSGEVYRPDQPNYLLMNYINEKINMWSEDLPKPIVPQPLPYSKWLEKNYPEYPENIYTGYSSRGLVGKYLQDGFHEIKLHKPSHIQIFTHPAEVIDVEQSGDFYTLTGEYSDGSKINVNRVNQLLLTTGHGSVNAHKVSIDNYTDFVYPVEERLSHIEEGSQVLIKGMGLTFIDCALALTEGRGGLFQIVDEARFKYMPSGEEPKSLLAYSKSGIPMFPRNGSGGDSKKLLFFSDLKLEELSEKKSLDFERDLMPLIIAEIKYNYYKVLFKQYNYKASEPMSVEALNYEIDCFHDHHSELEKFSVNQLFDPLEEHSHNAMVDYLKMTVEEALKGEKKSPMAAAAATWRKLSQTINDLYCFGGFHPASHEQFVSQYHGKFNRIAYGPPVENVKKIIALADAGIVSFSHSYQPEIVFSKDEECWIIVNNEGETAEAYYHIDARIPKIDLEKSASRLYKSLLNHGIARPYVNQSDDGTSFAPGCIDLDKQGRPIGVKNQVAYRITLAGTPTEGLTYDNDTLSRTRNDFVTDWARRVVDDIRTNTKTSTYAVAT
ncbi:FAD/NAD(P)-binding protein [Fulvivirga sp. RKSG066]|uniref:FAD/NAD(P)-binding protein n=1 Tax=Fulvivirga aurantia TaxID=2529383 RepID=UPI0012BD66DC|nr:FAD/NAD(P)-binding protein [Fulvivirga aurantia]MTI21433.1 FAD/NAD(P)-binding protein [Fulvivirga aurantia]